MASARPNRLNALAQEAAFKLKRADEYRTSASILLAECKRRIDAGDPDAQGLTWTEYCRVHCPSYPPSHLHKLVGQHLFPAAGMGDAENSAAPRDPLDRAWAAFIMLPSARQQEFLRCGVAYTLGPGGASRQPAPGVLRWEA